MGYNKKISSAVINRLPRYYRYIGELYEKGVTRISSNELSQRMNMTASQIRQDLNNFGGFGQQGFGYAVDFVYNEIKKILGMDKSYNVIVIGGGNIGQALANYSEFNKLGINITAIFDANPKLIGMSIRGIKIYDIDTLEDYIHNSNVDVAVLSLPKPQTAGVVSRLLLCGVNCFWNFSPIDLELPDNALIENVHLTESLMTLLYRLNAASDN